MLPTPGNVQAMPQDTSNENNQIPAPGQAAHTIPPLPGVGTPAGGPSGPGGPPPLPGVPQSGAPAAAPAVPGQVSQAVHQPGPPPLAPPGAVPAGEPAPIPPAEEEAAVTVVDTQAAHEGQVIDQAPEVTVHQEAPPPIPAPQQAAPPPIPAAQPAPQPQVAPAPQAAPPAPAPEAMAAPAAPAQVAPAPVPQPQFPQGMVPQQAPAAQPIAAAQPAGVPAGFAAGGIAQQLAAMGFEGLDMGFGAFPIVKLQDQTFSTSDGDVLGNTFVCVMHQTRRKFLFKCDDSNDSDEMVYSYDKQTTTTGKSIEDVKAEWAAKGFVAPVWKEYTDVTAQLVDLPNREMGGVVVLSVPHTSNSRLSGYMTTLLVKGRQPNQVITQVYPGQRITSAKKPFYPWAFREYTTVQALLGG